MVHFFGSRRDMVFLAVTLLASFLILIPASAADDEIDAFLGETITLHGYSYVGDTVYLFMTGPGLPANGVALTDISMRADQGHFTMVGVDENQAWSFKWDTSRIANEIDPGTYTVYVTNQPSDRANLVAGSYKEITVFLRESDYSQVSITAQHAYTLNPEEHTSTPRATTIPTTEPVSTVTTVMVTPATPPTTATLPPVTRADPGTGILAAAVVAGIVLHAFRRS